jgi:hypothetical protein
MVVMKIFGSQTEDEEEEVRYNSITGRVITCRSH